MNEPSDEHVARIAAQIVRRCSSPLAPLATQQMPRLPQLSGIRSVVFDIYGTMLVSGCGEVGTAETDARAEAIGATWAALGVDLPVAAEQIAQRLEATIHSHHRRAQQAGVPHPEVNIVTIWKEVLADLADRGTSPANSEIPDPARLALEYEMRINPVWPMPGLEACLSALNSAGLTLGIVSNAQFFTPLLFEPLVGRSLSGLGFPADLQFFSYRYGRAKPDGQLFQLAAAALARRGLASDEVLYIGNDMRNDIAGAARVGFRTALFAGDRRSLRLREEDPHTPSLRPDLVLTELEQLPGCILVLPN